MIPLSLSTKLHRTLAILIVLTLLTGLVPITHPVYAANPTVYTGSINGADYKVEVPANWNGTLVLYSHGYRPPGSPNPASDVGDPITGGFLLSQGYALAGSAYRTTGWALEQAFEDQTALLDWFENNVGKPQRTIAWGHSLGGIITAGLVQKFPSRFSGALPMCGVLAGGVGIWNQVLDGAFAFKTLLAPTSDVQLVHITNPAANLAKALQILTTAQATPQGQARIALLAALADVPGWFDPTSPEPAADDYVTREQNQFRWSAGVDFAFIFAFRAELEARARGNPSWNTGVDYRKQLERSINRDEVMALYQQTGLNLEDDLRILESAPRIAADPHAVKYLINNIIFDGQLQLPVLTMHTTGDGLVTVENERAYASVVHAAGKDATLRQTYVHRAGHCTFTPAETITAFQTLIHRLDTNNWGTADNPQALNLVASALGPNFNLWLVGNTPVPTAPAFMQYQPAPFLRPFDTRNVVTTDITAPRSMAGYVDSKAPLKNFLGADYLWTGQDTRPQTHRSLHGVFQFDLGGLPADAQVLEGQVQLMGGSSQYLNAGGGSWQLMLLNDSVDAGWTKLGYWQIHNAPTLGPARPTLTDQDIGSEIANTFELIPSQVGEIQSRLASSGKGSFRLDGDCTWPYGRHIFGWSAKASPSLQITYFHESFVR